MAGSVFYIPSINLIGAGCLNDAIDRMVDLGFKRALVVTDSNPPLLKLCQRMVERLGDQGIVCAVYDGVKPNPTTHNVEAGLAVWRQHQADVVISFGGGSPHDCAKGIALVAANGGKIEDYEGLDKSAKPQLPLVAVNTTAGTASEMTRFCIITDESRHVKMAIVDKHTTPIMSVNDPDLMVGMPPSLTAATGMDALTHAVEAYVSIAATPITDACALQAVSLIGRHLRHAVDDGSDIEAREQMVYAQFLAGMAFNNASLGYVHAMAHQLGGFYDLPHGVCNAVLLPHVQAYNSQAAADRLAQIGQALQPGAKSATEALQAIRLLSVDVGIPKGLAELGVKSADIPLLASNALKDACGLTNPVRASQADIERIFLAAM
ncbi:L-threonine dehydrogenase [Paludibacterium purpuratum]|uniref:Alcohol dehydrogenase n=1 Tax=Paludibacterium purpuratum TaxID=1144873 RepID=A0A4R7BBH6_9NEIS|nr:L-threonine dehydrogenase [Paludibacterium purpuratum]TDR82003.1 alcohol dehydrogenase [Paludibacterium purpuratum]